MSQFQLATAKPLAEIQKLKFGVAGEIKRGKSHNFKNHSNYLNFVLLLKKKYIEKNRLKRHRCTEQIQGHQGGGRGVGMNWEIRINIYTLLI